MSSLSAFQGNRIFRHSEAGRSARSLRTRTPSPSQRRLPWMLVAVRPSAPAIELTETLSSQSAIRRRTSSTDHGFRILGAPPPERLFGGGGQVKRRNALSDLGFLEAEIERERRHAVAGARHSHHQPVDDWPRRRLVWRCLVRRRCVIRRRQKRRRPTRERRIFPEFPGKRGLDRDDRNLGRGQGTRNGDHVCPLAA